MKETGDHIVNMMRTKRGEHCLFRSFGLSMTDSVGALRKGVLTEEIAKWYPSVESINVERLSGEGGESSYRVTVKEV